MDKSIHSKKYKIAISLLKQARVDAGISQEKLAERISETQTFVSKCERGERRIDIVELSAFCEAIGLSFMDYVKLFQAKANKNE